MWWFLVALGAIVGYAQRQSCKNPHLRTTQDIATVNITSSRTKFKSPTSGGALLEYNDMVELVLVLVLVRTHRPTTATCIF